MNKPHDIADVVRAAIGAEIRKIINEEADLAGARAKERIQRNLGALATTVIQRYDMRVMGHELVISVDTRGLTLSPKNSSAA